MAKRNIRPMPPNSLKLTQTSVDRLKAKATARLATPMKTKNPTHDQLRRFQICSGSSSCSLSMVRMKFFLKNSAPPASATAKAQ